MESRNAGGRGEEEKIRDETRGEATMKMCVVVVVEKEEEEEENHDESVPLLVLSSCSLAQSNRNPFRC